MEAVAPALAYALLHSLWQCALLGIAAALTLRAMASACAAWRHTVAMAFLIAMALAPAAQLLIFWQADTPMYELLLPELFAPLVALLGDNSPAPWIVTLLWAAGVIVMLARYAGGVAAIAAMERAPYRDVPQTWRQVADDLQAKLGIAKSIAVQLSDDIIGPCATHLLRPIVWLPASLLTQAPPEHIKALLAHELAHIARKDSLWNAIQIGIDAFLFFHPAVWWLSRRTRQEREHACDDLAVAAGSDSIALAEALAALERERHAPRLALAARSGSLLQRVTRLLGAQSPRRRWALPAVLGALTVIGLLLTAQVGVGGGQALDLVISASTSGELGPGDYREITANENGQQRFYRASVDANGRLTEVYRENGELHPLDAEARAWIADVMSLDLATTQTH
jgi:beta-lactamase regulating signal transducer with metallopeptidase domain